MDHFRAIGILGVAARVERSNRMNAEARGEALEVIRLTAIIEDYESSLALLQAPSLCALCASVRKDALTEPQRTQSSERPRP
jgi:hypothetical protein